MDMLMALAVSIGVLIAVWVKVGEMASLAVPAWIGAWACFFPAGGKITGLQKTIASTLSGVVWVWLAMTLIGAMGMGNILDHHRRGRLPAGYPVKGGHPFLHPRRVLRGGDHGVGRTDGPKGVPDGGGRAGRGREIGRASCR